MHYLGEKDLELLGVDWQALFQVMEDTLHSMDQGKYAQPIKPFLRYGNPTNRIIAMPAYVGGTVHQAGLKWVASFPDNIHNGLPRAHSIVVLNEADTGVPQAIINTPLLSVLRTAAVSGMFLKHYGLANRPTQSVRIGIIGWGPIGRSHLQMCLEAYGEAVSHVMIHDLRGVDVTQEQSVYNVQVSVAKSWEEVYAESDVVITCTAAPKRYINQKPRAGMLLLHVSLRDYEADAIMQVDRIVVDDWEEVCRENTDIERLSLEKGLQKSDTSNLIDIVCHDGFKDLKPEDTVLFSPMGMAVFDIAVGHYYWQRAVAENKGTRL
ncbi:2,3-diaminopropionate biosynthesis protein SbnB [Paenibacillus sp. N1-5-1-14]|uniref:2,3-diaminopropionate biosynthesis protein SbnB n=1 Tax=Paenibacillus radicibacter TaxID=2972488 RepID=UPI0021594034|nr:2,3-diaminopropionate biosynthesis protein SbnB [Paenibacillus radicibacter]MCR8642093.1 2,3-diaminopropionate biosynthesis protein SbnB [Paenibacillus radicibacter]